jgi:uncharacterized protein (TIGR03067 family)
MSEQLPARPHLDHLRRQAKTLLATLQEGDADAVATFQEHLPAARDMTAEQVRQAGFRLADAQSAVARKMGFASWPQLARHVETLRALEGTWSFERLVIAGTTIPATAISASRILIDGDRFRTESPEAIYEGVFNIDVDADPHEIDIEFVQGPESGNTNHGIFQLDDDMLEICLDISGAPRPATFHAAPGTQHAFETLRRSSRARPDSVTGGTPPTHAAAPHPTAPHAATPTAPFEYVDSATMRRLQGEWSAVKLVRDGMPLPRMMLASGSRSTAGHKVKVSFAGQVVVDALMRLAEGMDPIHVEYQDRSAGCAGQVQLGILRWDGDNAVFCMATPGLPRPDDFTSEPGSGRTLSQWRPRKGTR